MSTIFSFGAILSSFELDELGSWLYSALLQNGCQESALPHRCTHTTRTPVESLCVLYRIKFLTPISIADDSDRNFNVVELDEFLHRDLNRILYLHEANT